MGKPSIVLIIFFLVSCAGIGRGVIQSPKLSVEDVKLKKVHLDNQEILVDLKITNPNSFSLPVRGVSYRLDFNGVEFARGFNSQSIDIPSNGDNKTTLVITGNLLSFVQKFNIVNLNNLTYSITGDISILSTNLRFPYSHEGELRADKFY